jgi:hypothetical protein
MIKYFSNIDYDVHFHLAKSQIKIQLVYGEKKGKVHFWPSNYCLSLVLAIELQNRVSSTLQLLKPFTIGHRAILMGDFNFFYLQFSPYIL